MPLEPLSEFSIGEHPARCKSRYPHVDRRTLASPTTPTAATEHALGRGVTVDLMWVELDLDLGQEPPPAGLTAARAAMEGPRR